MSGLFIRENLSFQSKRAKEPRILKNIGASLTESLVLADKIITAEDQVALTISVQSKIKKSKGNKRSL
jgi:hypothetical protein